MKNYTKRTITIILLPVLMLVVMGYLVHDIVASQDEKLNDEQTGFFRAVIQKQADDFSVLMRDYALWNEVVDNIIKNKDLDWSDDNIGSYLIDAYDLNATIVLTPDNKEFMRFDVDPKIRSAGPTQIIENKEIIELIKDARSHSPKAFKAYGEWVKINNEIYLVGAAAITYQYNFKNKVETRTEAEKHVLLFFKKADQAYWDVLAKQYSLPALGLDNKKIKGFRISIHDRHEHSIASLVMSGKTDIIESIFLNYGLIVAFLLFLLVLIAFFAFKRSVDFETAHGEVVILNGQMDELVRLRTKELEKAVLEAEAASKAKTTFLSSMSHEFRTPLNGILGFAQLMQLQKNSALSEKEKGWLEQIIKGGNLLLVLVSDVLDMAHVESGRIALNLQAVEPRDVFKQCYDSSIPAAEARDITLIGEYESDKFIEVDQRRLHQILLNLIGNAIKYNKEGGSVTFGCTEISTGMIRLYVKDTGQGISEEDQRMIFEPFYRSASVSHVIEGTGVGLALVVRLAEAMNGKIHLESTLGEGSVFYIDFPAMNMV